MKRIKIFLIHLLGGMTVKESTRRTKNFSYAVAYATLTIIKEYADSLNGKPADE